MPVILCNCPPPVPSGTADGQVPVWDETTQSWIPGTAPTPDCCPPDGGANGDILLWEGSEWVAQQPSGGIDSGTSFPSSPTAGDIFYRTDLMETAYYDGTRWVGDIITLPMATYGVLPGTITESGIPFTSTVPDESILLVRWDVAYYLATGGDASNYWTYRLIYLNSSMTSVGLVTQDLTTNVAAWGKASHSLSTVLSSTDLVVHVQAIKTGSPGLLSLVSTLFVRRILT